MKVATRYRYPGGSTMSVDHRFSISRNTNMERRWRMRIGQSLGQRYQLVNPIGTGGMSVVWKAIDTRLNRIVAVKIPNKGQSTDDTFRLRFEAEAHSVAGLHVTGIVTVFDYGNDIDEDGLTVSYIVMEYVEGTSLLQLLVEADILDTQQTLRVIADAADALHSAHQAGIIHRDVKPANILVRNDGTVKIVDFGIARARASLGLTTTGTVLGTISYVSPEQFGNEPITHLSDIYSLGVVAYECLAGKRPFAADTPAAIVAGHMYQQPDPLPRHVPSKVVEAINHALAKDPTQRWQSARTFAMALRSNLDPTADIAPIIRGNDLVPQPILDRNLANEDTVANTTPAPAVPTSRHRQLVYIGASIVVLLLLGSIIMNPWTSPNQLPLDTTQAAASTSPSPKPSTSPPTPTETLKESTEPPPVNDPDPDPTEIVTTQPVPLVIGMNESDARASLSNAGFNNVTMNYWDGSGSYACIVNWQNPSPQTTVTTDTFIELSVQMTTSLSKCRPWSPN